MKEFKLVNQTGFSRRSVLGAGAGVAAAGLTACAYGGSGTGPRHEPEAALAQRLQAAADQPVLDASRIPDPVIISSIELLRSGKQFFVRVRDKDGAEGIALCNPSRMETLWPIFLSRVAPSYLGADARNLEAVQRDNFVFQLNYKWQGLA